MTAMSSWYQGQMNSSQSIKLFRLETICLPIELQSVLTIIKCLLTLLPNQLKLLKYLASQTMNGEKCVIPFFIGPTEYYHCSIANECETPSGLAKCQEGN